MIQFKRGKTISWANQTEPLADGQPGYDKDTHELKIGDGITEFKNLPAVGYVNISGKEDKSNKVSFITEDSTDTQYPSAKAMYAELTKLGQEIEERAISMYDGNSLPGHIGNDLDYYDYTCIGQFVYQDSDSSNALLNAPAGEYYTNGCLVTILPFKVTTCVDSDSTITLVNQILTYFKEDGSYSVYTRQQQRPKYTDTYNRFSEWRKIYPDTTTLNPVTSTTDDTVTKWSNLGNGTFYFNQLNCLIEQPKQWGFVINHVYGVEIFQEWHSQRNGAYCIRSGNGNGWATTWTQIGSN